MEYGNLKGTLIIAAIANDGIIIAVDSRMGIRKNELQVSACLDDNCKLVMLNKFPIAYGGNTLIGNDFIYNLIDDFNMDYSANNNIQQTMIDFEKYINRFNFNALFICGGYNRRKPYLFSLNNIGKKEYSFGFIASEPDLQPYLEEINNERKTCKELESILENTIYQYAKDKKIEMYIGGPISMIKIGKNNKTYWIKNNFMGNRFKTYFDFYKAIKNKELNLIELMPNGIEIAISSIEARLAIG